LALILALLCISGCLDRSAEQATSSFLSEKGEALEYQENASDKKSEKSSFQLNYDVELNNDSWVVRGGLVQNGPSPLDYVLLNATLSQRNEVKFFTKYLIMDVDPGKECSFEIYKNVKIPAGEYNCTLEAASPEGPLALELRRCSYKPSVSSGGEGTDASGWSEDTEKAFWTEVERGSQEAKAVQVELRGDKDSGDDDTGEEEVQVESEQNDDALQGAANKSENQVSDELVASSSSKKYHRSDCRYALKIKKENIIYFQSAEEAQDKGYLPCKVCHP